MTYPALTLALVAFWLVLSGHYQALLLELGALSVALVVWITFRLSLAGNLGNRLSPSLALFRYLGWLMAQAVKANIAVSRRVLDPKLPVEPCVKWVDVNVDSDLQRTLYANSVTFTPDTLVLRIDDDGRFLVHALWPESLEQFTEGEMQQRIRNTGI